MYEFRSKCHVFIHRGPVNIIQALVQVKYWCRPGDKRLSEPMMDRLQTHICVTRPHWVKGLNAYWNWLAGMVPLTDCLMKISFLTDKVGGPTWYVSYKNTINQATCPVRHEAYCRWPLLRHDDVIKWKHFPRYWPFVRGIHRSPVNSPHKGQWRGALMFSLICARINSWVNNGEAGDLGRNRSQYDVTVMNKR